MVQKLALALAGALALGAASLPRDAVAQPMYGGYGHHGWHGGGGWHRGGWRGGWHGGGWHGGGWRGGWHGGWGRGGYWGGPRHWGPRPIVVRPYPIYRPYPIVHRRVVIVRPYPVYRPYRVAYRPVGYGFGPRCVVHRRMGFTPYGFRKFVTVKKCIVP
jgi:hypothetical protein